MRKIFILVALLIMFSKTFIIAQQEAGDKELGIAGSFFRSIGGDMTMAHASAQGKLGLYVTDNLEIGISPMLSWSYTSYKSTVSKAHTRPILYYPYYETYYTYETETVSNDNTTFGAGIFMTYSFMASTKVSPYFGAQFYKDNFKNEDDKGSAGINAGIKFFISRKASWDFGLNYLFDLNDKTEGSPDGFLLVQIGLSFLF
jgi:hypothetical protein